MTAGKHNHVQVCTASHNNSPHFYFVILLWYFFTFLNFWANLSRLWHTDHCKKIACGKAQSHWRQATTTKWRQHKLFFSCFSLFVTLSEEKWKKDDVHSKPQRQPIRIQNLDKRRRMFAHFFTFLHFCDFLSKIEQDWPGAPILFLVFRKFWAILSYFWAILSYFWAILSKIEQDLPGPTNTFFSIASKIEQDLPGPTNTFFSIASNFEQNWAGFAGAHQYFFFCYWEHFWVNLSRGNWVYHQQWS